MAKAGLQPFNIDTDASVAGLYWALHTNERRKPFKSIFGTVSRGIPVLPIWAKS
jgi:hypothetical protein